MSPIGGKTPGANLVPNSDLNTVTPQKNQQGKL